MKSTRIAGSLLNIEMEGKNQGESAKCWQLEQREAGRA